MNYATSKKQVLIFFTCIEIIACTTATKEKINVPSGKEFAIDSLKTGIDTTFYENTKQPKMIGLLNNGKRNGIWKSFYENNKLWSEGEFNNDLSNGYSHVYYPNGNLRINGFYIEGNAAGIWEYFNEQAIKVYEVDYTKSAEGKVNKF